MDQSSDSITTDRPVKTGREVRHEGSGGRVCSHCLAGCSDRLSQRAPLGSGLSDKPIVNTLSGQHRFLSFGPSRAQRPPPVPFRRPSWRPFT